MSHLKSTLGLCIALLFVLGPLYSQSKPTGEFELFLTKLDAAQVELQNGKADSFKSLWSQAHDITLSGGFGGTIEKGWEKVSKRLDWAATQFSNGTNKIDRLVAVADGNMAYVVQLELIAFKVPATGADATRDFRVTMVFRREKGRWKIVHRHADGDMTKRPAQ